MTDIIYFEEQVAEHPRALKSLADTPGQPVFHADTTRKSSTQADRISDSRKKETRSDSCPQLSGKLVHPVPLLTELAVSETFISLTCSTVSMTVDIAFSRHVPSAHYLLFVNFEDFFSEMDRISEEATDEPSWFFSGYDCDSLAMENLSGFAKSTLPFFKDRPNSFWNCFEKRESSVTDEGCTVTQCGHRIQFPPQEISQSIEKGVPPVKTRIRAMSKLADQGWPIGLRLDPILDCQDFERRYAELIEDLFLTFKKKRFIRYRWVHFAYPNRSLNGWKNSIQKKPFLLETLKNEDARSATPRNWKRKNRGLQRNTTPVCARKKTIPLRTRRTIKHSPVAIFRLGIYG